MNNMCVFSLDIPVYVTSRHDIQRNLDLSRSSHSRHFSTLPTRHKLGVEKLLIISSRQRKESGGKKFQREFPISLQRQKCFATNASLYTALFKPHLGVLATVSALFVVSDP